MHEELFEHSNTSITSSERFIGVDVVWNLQGMGTEMIEMGKYTHVRHLIHHICTDLYN